MKLELVAATTNLGIYATIHPTRASLANNSGRGYSSIGHDFFWIRVVEVKDKIDKVKHEMEHILFCLRASNREKNIGLVRSLKEELQLSKTLQNLRSWILPNQQDEASL